ncbi:MAG: hypothetical protein NPIRA03_20620 [Nitrospirales bacterium]|nr:MAG: hypothetical protein NPIRA03_20620 [Nitrospirales bacterium]
MPQAKLTLPQMEILGILSRMSHLVPGMRNHQVSDLAYGSVEKIRQVRSRHFPVLTYEAYAPRVKTAAALLDGPFGKTQGMLF